MTRCLQAQVYAVQEMNPLFLNLATEVMKPQYSIFYMIQEINFFSTLFLTFIRLFQIPVVHNIRGQDLDTVLEQDLDRQEPVNLVIPAWRFRLPTVVEVRSSADAPKSEPDPSWVSACVV